MLAMWVPEQVKYIPTSPIYKIFHFHPTKIIFYIEPSEAALMYIKREEWTTKLGERIWAYLLYDMIN